MDMGLKDKVAVITGGNIGIGLAIAEGLAAEGAHVALTGRNEARTRAAARQVAGKYGTQAIPVIGDITNTDDIERITKTVEDSFGGVDILINNAGEGTEETIMDAPDDRWQYYWELHVMAAVRLSRAFVPMMRQRGGGVILNNASICATQPMSHEPIYNTTKAALVMMSKCLSNELIPFNIRVNVVNPGLILTPGWTDAPPHLTANGDLDKIARDNAAIGRFASPEELANVFVFLCSPRASYCVGSSYYVDGGWLKVVN